MRALNGNGTLGNFVKVGVKMLSRAFAGLIITGLLMGTVVACNSSSSTSDPSTSPANSKLANTAWILESTSENGTVAAVPGGVESTLKIEGAETLLVHPGCNSGTGTVQIGADQISVGAIALTRKLCVGPESDVEKTVLAVLQGQVAYQLVGTTLTLTKGPNSLTYRAS